jgi:hypothetical protein
VGQKQLVWKAAPPSKRGIDWPRWTGFRGMTVRNWLPIVGALLIPVMIAFGTWGITWQQGKIEDQRAEAEQKLAAQRAQDEALQAYLDQMSQLILQRDLLESEEGDPAHILAQARTSTVIRRIDAEHNESLIRFLSDSGLAGTPVAGTSVGESSISLLRDIDLNGADLSYADLSGADLSYADLSSANLREAYLNGADLSGANLGDANLESADLSGAGVSGADLRNANLTGVKGPTNEELEQRARKSPKETPSWISMPTRSVKRQLEQTSQKAD